ncbi:DNA polymerase nu isoform X2 [Ascaphus truei]|uniref:DNA polymerase nu isoform X2 n=1 Tax=Ascaphus truei TaxID=8439 RepID=UPI003F5A0D94
MEKYRHEFGLYSYKEPLSDTAQRILIAMQSIPPDRTQNEMQIEQKKTFKTQPNVEKNCRGNIFQEDHTVEAKSKELFYSMNMQPGGYNKSSNDLILETLWDHKNNKMQNTSAELDQYEPLAIDLKGRYHPQNCLKTLDNMSGISHQDMFCIADNVKNDKATVATSMRTPEVFSKLLTTGIVRLTDNMICPKQLQPLGCVSSVSKKSDIQIQKKRAGLSVVDNICHVSEDERKLLSFAQKPLKWDSSSQMPEHCFPERSETSKRLHKCNNEVVKCDQTQLCDTRSMGQEEQCRLLEETKQARALILTMVFQDGSSQLSTVKDPTALMKGIVILIKRHNYLPSIDSINAETNVTEDKYVYLAAGDDALWRKQQAQQEFIRKLLLLILHCKVNVICFNAKDFLRTVLLIYGKNMSWKKVLKSVVLDPKIAAWLLDPVDSSPSFEDLVAKYSEKLDLKTSRSATDSSYQKMTTNLNILYTLMMNLQSKLQTEGLWELFCSIELPLTTILAVMENHKIQVNQEELKKTSEILGIHLKKLEREAHHAAGQKFRLTSSNELREVLYDKLHLHLLCKTKKLPRTNLRHLPSTAETVLHQLQDLHPLPKIILEYRQIQKIKSTFVDGLLSCISKGCVSSTWNHTGTVSGRLSAKHPNIQGVPRLPVQITKQQCIQDFSQIELRILAHFSSDPELLKLFQETESTDVFTTLASQWKDVAPEHVTYADREQAKRIAYSVVYGAGKERLSEYLGITPAEANQFIESFLQKYKLSEFTQRIIQQCHNKGFVISLMGRKRPLPQINSQSYNLRTQAERQAVNFVIQGSAADLCKMAMIKISASIATSSTLTSRLIAQIHDELLFEVEDSQVLEFAALVKHIMESLQQLDGEQLKVPLKVSLTTGKSWGCMSEFREEQNHSH